MWLQQAEDHCRLALTIDPALPEGHLARAWILWSPAKNFQHAEAIAALERVLAARPTLERAHNRMATICLHIGRLEEGRFAHEQALRSNPTDSNREPRVLLHLQWRLRARGRGCGSVVPRTAGQYLCACDSHASPAVERTPGARRGALGDRGKPCYRTSP